MTTQPEECVYWFRTYQIDNSDDRVLEYDFKVRLDNYNREIISRLLLGDKHDAEPDNLVSFTDPLIGKNKPYEILTFKQRTRNGSTPKSDDTRCIYSIIIKKDLSESLEKMWFAVFCPTKVCSGVACGRFSIWKVNFEGIPNLKLMWDYSSAKDYYSRCCMVTWFKGKGEKAIFGAIGKQGNNAKFYFSPLSFYLEGRHEDALKKYPLAGYTSGMDVYYLQFNTENLDPQPN